MEVVTQYELAEGKVSAVRWSNGTGDTCEATLTTEGNAYTYTSRLDDDKKPVAVPWDMSLADCILAANMHLGLIPPHNFERIASPNQH
jgi:hypothetical protein